MLNELSRDDSLCSEKNLKIYTTFDEYFHKNDFVSVYNSSWNTVVAMI